MKRFFSVMAMAATAMVMGVSCWSSDSDYEPMNTAVVSIVDGDALSGMYAIFDDNKRAFIENGSDLTVSKSAYFKGEARALVAYTDVATQPMLGFDHTINVSQLVELKTVPVKMGITDDIIEKYTAGVELPYYSGGISYARDRFLNIQYIYRCGGASMTDKHDFQLVYNPERKGTFALGYPKNDDGYLYLELHHSVGADTSTHTSAENIISFYLTDEMINKDITNDYFGIKILYRDFKSADISVAEYKFAK
ncbi:MAG: hypothetical protein J6L75_03865 [Alistipes sp.]|nr:hypothetical protein [Alistipes sp.]